MGIAFGACVLDIERRELRVDGQPVDLQRQVFDVLAYLVDNADRVVSKDELLDSLWGDRFVSESALATRIKEVRRAVGDSGSTQAVIKTMHGVGYRFVAELQPISSVDETDDEEAHLPVPRTVYAGRSGTTIAYQRFGEGPDLVIISGFTTNVELLWEHPDIARLLRLLGSFARVTLFDKRGVGCSERLPAEQIPGLDVRLDDLVAVMDDAGIGRANLLGTSEGGSLAALFAATHPERVERLALHGTWAQSPRAFEENVSLVEENWGKGYIYGALSPRLAETKDGRRFLARYERQSATPRLAASVVEMLTEIDVTGILGAITVPTVIIHAPADEWVPFDQAELLHAGIDGSSLVSLSGPDHYLFSCDPDELIDALRSMVAGDLAGPDPEPDDRQLATVLWCEIVGSTPVDRSEPAFERWHRSAVSAVGVSRGEMVDRLDSGEGADLVAVFDSPGRAIGAARAVVSTAAQFGLTARCGLHCAEVRRSGRSLAGVGVDIAAGITQQVGPGEVWVSRTITDLVAGTGLGFVDEGEHRLAAVDRPWRLYSVSPS